MEKEYFIKGKRYVVKPSTRRNKKYDVYTDDRYLLSFGDNRYEQYNDRIGYYSNLNHYDKNRRNSYKSRHHFDNINNPNYAGYWSWWFLW